MSKVSTMTHALNAIATLDKTGWGRTGAAAGAAIGGGVGMFSDDTSILGGAFKGAIAGGLAGKGLRFGSRFLRDEAGMEAYRATSMGAKMSAAGQRMMDATGIHSMDDAIVQGQKLGESLSELSQKLKPGVTATAAGA